MRFSRAFFATLAIALSLAPPALATPSPAHDLAAITLAANLTTETLVGTTPTALPAFTNRTAILIFNFGPADLWCSLGNSTKAIIGKAQRVPANGGQWPLRGDSAIAVWCIASIAQVTGHATITTEAFSGIGSAESALYPRGYVMLPRAPTKLTVAAPGEAHFTLSQTGACLRIYCNVDAAYLTSPSGTPATATADSNPIPSRWPEKGCAGTANDYFSVYLSAAGSCYVSESHVP